MPSLSLRDLQSSNVDKDHEQHVYHTFKIHEPLGKDGEKNSMSRLMGDGERQSHNHIALLVNWKHGRRKVLGMWGGDRGKQHILKWQKFMKRSNGKREFCFLHGINRPR